MDGVNIEVDVDGGNALDVALSVHGGRWDHFRGTEVLERFRSNAHIDPDEGIEVESLSFWTPHLKVDVADAHVALPFDHDYGGHARVRVNLAHLAELPHAFELPPLDGIVEVEADVEGAAAGPSATGTVAIEHAHVKQFGTGDVTLPFELTPEGVHIEGGLAEIIDEGGEVDLDVDVSFADGMPIEIDLAIRDLEFAHLMEQLGVTPDTIVQWHFEGRSRLRGTLDPLDIRGPTTFDTRDFLITQDAYHREPQRRVVGVERALIRTTTRVQPDGLHFDRIDATLPRSRLEADVLLGFDDTLYVSARSDRLDLADATPLLNIPIGGVTELEVEVTGKFQDPDVSGTVTIDEFAFNTFPLGDVHTSFQLEEDAMAVRMPLLEAVKNESTYAVEDLFLDFRNDAFSAEGGFHSERMTLADFYHVFHYEEDERFEAYQGLFTGDAHVRYTLGYPGDSALGTMIADLDLSVVEATLNDFAFTDGEVRGQYRWLHPDRGVDGAELDLEHASLRKGAGVLNVSGKMGLGGVLDMSAAADRISIRDTEGLAERMPDLGGVYSAFGSVRGTLDVPHAELDVVLTGLSHRTSMLGDGRLYVRMTDRHDPWVSAAEHWDPGNLPEAEPCHAARNGLWRGRWRPDPPYRTPEGPVPRTERPMAFLVCGEGLGGQLHVDMAIGKTLTYPLRGEVALRGLSLDPFLRDLDDEEPLTGRLSTLVTLTGGGMKEPEALSGRVQVTELDVGQGDVRLTNDGALDVRIDEGTMHVARAELSGPSSRLRITGDASFRDGLALELAGEIDLSFLGRLSPSLTHAEGLVGVAVNITGPVDAPGVYGRATIRDGSFRYAGFPEPLTELAGDVTFSARRILFESFRASMAGGELALSGAATLRGRGIDRYDFDIEGRDVSLHPDSNVDVALGGLVHLGWTREQRLPRLTGTVRLARVYYAKPIVLGTTINDLQRQGRTEVEQYDPDADLLEIDLRVVDEAPLRIQNNLIDAEVRIEDSERPFRIVGTDQRFGTVGTLTIPRGVIYFRNTEFDVRRGIVSFDDAYQVDPNFDIQAVADIRRSTDLTAPNWRVTLSATGNADSFRLATSSQPELSQEDILLLLTVGMTRAEAQQLQAGDLGSTLALEALAAVTGIDREVRRAVPVIDDFSISSRYSPRSNRTEPQVTIGKRITDRVRVTASTGVSDSSEVRASVEWRLSDQTSVQAVYDNYNTTTASSFGNVGVDVRWRLEFE
jgi:translocation and assembly module TamB